MKKLLTILLALLLVTGVVFAADDPSNGDADFQPKLTITADVEGGQVWHGFSSYVNPATEAGIKSAGDVGAIAVNIVGGEGITLSDQSLASYGLYITQNENVDVSLESNWVLTGTVGESEDSSVSGWEVPYALTVTQGDRDGSRVITLKNTTIGEAKIGTKPTAPTPDSLLNIFTASDSFVGTGLGWTSVLLAATFVDNVDKIPEGNYTGTITALINAQ